jgi:catechol 2,3-dioxygenase-like lactoylglutathione lyase family enzyme
MTDMRLDHVSFAASPLGLDATTAWLSDRLGESFIDGGIHPRFGTRNRVLPLADGQYLEVVDVLDHPASDKAPFGQAVRARSEAGGGWLGWVLSVPDIADVESRLQRPAIDGNRHRPDGVELKWQQLGVKGLQSDPQLPFFVQWQTPPELHPSVGSTGRVSLLSLDIAGDPHRVAEWVGLPDTDHIGGIEINWRAPNGTPGLMAATFDTPGGQVTI